MTRMQKVILVSLLALLAAHGPSVHAFPGKEKAAEGGAASPPVLGGQKAIPESAADPLDEIALPPVVVKVDGKEYGAPLFREYVRDVLSRRPLNLEEVLPLVDQMALDIAAADDVLAEDPSLAEDPLVLQQVARVRGKVLRRVFYAEEIERKYRPSEADVLLQVPPKEPEYELSVISADKYSVPEGQDGFAAAEAKIRKVEEALKAGTPFEQLASDPRYSDSPASDKKGVLFTITPKSFSPFNEAEFAHVKELKEGQVSAPFPTRLGYAIVRLNRFRTIEELARRDLEANRPAYEAKLRKEEYDRRYAEILGRSKVEWNEENVKAVREALEAGKGIRDRGALELVRVNGRPILGTELDELAAAHSLETLDIYLDKRVREELLAQEAERLGLGAEAAPIVDLARRRAVVRRHIDRKKAAIPSAEADLRGFYEANRERYRLEEGRRLTIIETADRKKAEKGAKEGRKGKDFADLAARLNDSAKARDAKGNAGFLGKANLPPDIAAKVFSAKEGEVLGPFEGKDREGGKAVYTVVKVEEVVPAGYRPFESVNRQVLLDRYLAGKMQEINKEFLDRVHSKHGFEFLMKKDGGRGNDEKKG